MKTFGKLAELAEREPPPPTVNASGVLARIAELSPDADEEYVPIRLFAGVGALATVAAAVVLVFAAWSATDLYGLGRNLDQLFDVMDAIL
ncbi:MAG: hypothetical protein LBT97_02460 [Planctomycetota bacterium]|nr:hypothetical protein [Planctomycetota bacterium]